MSRCNTTENMPELAVKPLKVSIPYCSDSLKEKLKLTKRKAEENERRKVEMRKLEKYSE